MAAVIIKAQAVASELVKISAPSNIGAVAIIATDLQEVVKIIVQ